jgi:hypothetical protein
MATITLTLGAILALLAGILVLAFPKFLRYAVGIYLVAIGAIELFGVYLGI